MSAAVLSALETLRPIAQAAVAEDQDTSDSRPIPKTLNAALTPIACLAAREAANHSSAKDVIVEQASCKDSLPEPFESAHQTHVLLVMGVVISFVQLPRLQELAGRPRALSVLSPELY